MKLAIKQPGKEYKFYPFVLTLGIEYREELLDFLLLLDIVKKEVEGKPGKAFTRVYTMATQVGDCLVKTL